ncbi:cytochrome c biogenesis protein CcsA [Prevotella falsenii]|uniref:cytochrome c biogenesis protein CcsA n=1 Tax=Prevotella falsenii TaxID=515414 RepID=UPI00046981D3|nr:cytochrome c biogenesis protein CcsA [Prevotella falsenii]
MIKKVLCALYITIILVMAVATVVEHFYGTPYVSTTIYGSRWFTLLWTLLAAVGLTYIFKQRLRKWSTLLLHLSFVVILLGAFLTHTTAFKGIVHLRGDQPTNKYTIMTAMNQTETRTLPFSIKLDRFAIDYHSGTKAAADYTTHFAIIDGEHTLKAQVSMNKVYDYKGVRFYQASYDTDNRGSYLSVNSDRWGIPVTYTGYGLLFLSLIWLLIDPKGTFRQLLKSPVLKKGALVIALLFGSCSLAESGLSLQNSATAATVVPRETAEKFGQLFINYNERICPMQTFAYEMVKKLYGKRSYNGYSPEQILMSWILFPEDWNNEPIIKIKSSEMRQQLDLPEYTTAHAFFSNGAYRLGTYVEQYRQGNQDAFHKACADIDSKLQIVMTLQQGIPLTIFPHTQGSSTVWYSPNDVLPKSLPQADVLFIKNIFAILHEYIVLQKYTEVNTILGKIRKYQLKNGGTSIPSDTQVKAERLYNQVPFATILFMFNLAMGLLTLGFTLYRLVTKKDKVSKHISRRTIERFSLAVLFLSETALTVCLALRWIVSGNIPLSNGYETMLTVAWLVILVAFAAYRKARITLVFAFLLSGFFLLVSHISQMDPAIGQMMPVLNSPLLSVHVSIIMMSYALLALTFICGLTALTIYLIYKVRTAAADQQKTIADEQKAIADQQLQALQVLSRLFLYPAITTMGLGIFIGAIWANISWGNYWSWDPKETWSLITLLVYAVVLHTQSLPSFRKPLRYHVYMVLAFLCILMTYFGVNYFLGGMHSYA